jgi:hypothetical protein
MVSLCELVVFKNELQHADVTVLLKPEQPSLCQCKVSVNVSCTSPPISIGR